MANPHILRCSDQSLIPFSLSLVKFLSHIWLFVTPWTVTYQALPSMEFSRQEYWSGLPFPSQGDLPDPGIEPRSPALQADALPSEPPGKPPTNSSDPFGSPCGQRQTLTACLHLCRPSLSLPSGCMEALSNRPSFLRSSLHSAARDIKTLHWLHIICKMCPKPFLQLKAHSDLPPSSVASSATSFPWIPLTCSSQAGLCPHPFLCVECSCLKLLWGSRLHFFRLLLSCHFLREAFWHHLRQQLPVFFHLFLLHGALHPLISNPQIQPAKDGNSQIQRVSCNKPLSIWDLHSTDFVIMGAPKPTPTIDTEGELCLVYPSPGLSFPHNTVLPIHLLCFVLILPMACKIVSHSLSQCLKKNLAPRIF